MTNIPDQQWWFVPTQQHGDFSSNSCPIAQIVSKGKQNPANPSSGQDNFPVPYNKPTGESGLSVEHVCKYETFPSPS